MTNEDCAQAFRELAAHLQQIGFDWIITQVNETIVIGKTHEISPKALKRRTDDIELGALLPIEPPSQRSKEAFVETVDYSAREQLLLLLDAIDQGFLKVFEIEEKVTGLFVGEISGFRGISFESEGNSIIPPFTLSPDMVVESREHVEKLSVSLAAFCSEVINEPH